MTNELHAEQHIYECWVDALQHAYKYAKADRLATLRRRSLTRFDGRGLHRFSEECGRIGMCEHLLPVLGEAGFDPLILRGAAVDDADEEYRAELVAA